MYIAPKKINQMLPPNPNPHRMDRIQPSVGSAFHATHNARDTLTAVTARIPDRIAIQGDSSASCCLRFFSDFFANVSSLYKRIATHPANPVGASHGFRVLV
jgi:hypothetical protein